MDDIVARGQQEQKAEDAFVLRFERIANGLFYKENREHLCVGPAMKNLARAIYRALKEVSRENS